MELSMMGNFFGYLVVCGVFCVGVVLLVGVSVVFCVRWVVK